MDAALAQARSGHAHRPLRGDDAVVRLWEALRILNDRQIAHGDLRSQHITVDDGAVLFGSFGSAEYGATDAQLQSDIAQLLVTASALYDPKSAVAPRSRCSAQTPFCRRPAGSPKSLCRGSFGGRCRTPARSSPPHARR